jgi:tRNA threonylcarbamoyladenosine biosynthesis protein TsaE
MMTHKHTTHSAEETEALAAALAPRLSPGSVVALFGGLGAGKTAFVRGLARGLGCAGEVCSPTYAIINEYQGKPPLAHFDMYRVEGWESLESNGWFDYLGGGHVLAVEWSENILAAIPGNARRVTIAPGEDEHSRVITIEEGKDGHPGG